MAEDRIVAATVPMEARLSLAEVDDLIHPADRPAFAEKNSITYQGIVRNARVTSEEGYLTTSGKTLKKSSLIGPSGKEIGSKLTDENGKEYNIPYSYVLDRAFPLKSYTGGDIVAATVHNNKIFILFKNADEWSLVVADLLTQEMEGLFQLNHLKGIDPCICATISSTEIEGTPTLWMLTKSEVITNNQWKHEVYEVPLVPNTSPIKYDIKYNNEPLNFPLGHKMSAWNDNDMYIVGFEDEDQLRRGFFKLVKSTGELVFTPLFGTVSPEGVITGEPIPVFDKKFDLNKDAIKRNEDGTLKWTLSTLAAPGNRSVSICVGMEKDGTLILAPEAKETSQTFWPSVDMSTNDKDNTEFFISNNAGNRGIYYEWGCGWAKAYFRVAEPAKYVINKVGLFTAGTVPSPAAIKSGGIYTRWESLIAGAKQDPLPYIPENLNKRVYTVGNTNIGSSSLLGTIPFQVELTRFIHSQVYGLAEVSISFLNTLLSTPSEGKGDASVHTIIAKTVGGNIIFDANTIYVVKSSSSVNDLQFNKVADYVFRLNVLDGKNIITETREGTVSLNRAFIPYNMDCELNIKPFELVAPTASNDVAGLTPASGEEWTKKLDTLLKDAVSASNNYWYEGIGYNVNLDVSDPAMSFLLPRISIPLWIDVEKDLEKFTSTTMERRQSILVPVLPDIRDTQSSFDIYFTLQSYENTKCSYKGSQKTELSPSYQSQKAKTDKAEAAWAPERAKLEEAETDKENAEALKNEAAEAIKKTNDQIIAQDVIIKEVDEALPAAIEATNAAKEKYDQTQSEADKIEWLRLKGISDGLAQRKDDAQKEKKRLTEVVLPAQQQTLKAAEEAYNVANKAYTEAVAAEKPFREEYLKQFDILKTINPFGSLVFDIAKKDMLWWAEKVIIFPLGVGSTILGVNFITPSAQLPQGYASRLYTRENRLFLGFNYYSQIWYGSTIFTIYGGNYYYDGQGIYYVGENQNFTNNTFITYALGMKFLANSGAEAYFYSDFEKRLYVFTGSNTLQPAELLSSVKGTIIDAVFSSKEQALYMLTSEGRIIVRTSNDLCQLPDMNVSGHLEGTTEGAAIVDVNSYKLFSPWKGETVLPFALRTEHFGTTEYLLKLSYVDVILYKDDENVEVKVSCQTLNGIEKTAEDVIIKVSAKDWKGNTYRVRFTPKLNVGNAFDVSIHSNNKVGVQNITFYTQKLGTGAGDSWQDNVVSHTAPDDGVFE